MRLTACFLVLLTALGANVGAQDTSPAKAGEVLATVANHQITREMLDNIIKTIPEENRVPFLTPDGRKKILDEVVSFLLFSEAARARGIDKEPAAKTRLDYEQTQWLAREFFRRHLEKEPPVSDEEAKAYFKSHQSEFKPPEEMKARHILVLTEAEANKIMDKIKAGEDFEQLASTYSIDPAKAFGGKLELPDGREWLPKGTFEMSFEHALFKIPKGQVGGPIKTQFCWHILKVEDRRQPEIQTAQALVLVKNRLQEQKNAEIHKKLSEELKKSIPTTIK